MKAILIVAVDKYLGIGKDNSLMWHLPDDMKFFKEMTEGHVVIMGRKNYESIPDKYRPLPNRENVILTRDENFKAEGCVVFNSFLDCIDAYENEENRKVFIIGGAEIYRLAMESHVIEEMYITHVDKSYKADTFFYNYSPDNWNIELVSEHPKDERHEVAFTIRKYTKK